MPNGNDSENKKTNKQKMHLKTNNTTPTTNTLTVKTKLLTSCKVQSGTAESTLLQLLGIMGHGNGMQIDDAKVILGHDPNAVLDLWLALGVLKLDPLTDGTEVVPEMEGSCWLHS